MNSSKQRGQSEPRGLQGDIQEVRPAEKGLAITIRLRNPLSRAAHFISDVRGLIFDAQARRLRVQLSDRGREVVPGGMAVQPRFRVVEPNGQADLTVQLPRTIVKLAPGSSPAGEVRFEEHNLAEADEIVLEIGWSDTPFYPDPREKSSQQMPAALWEQQALRIAVRPREKR